MLQMMIGETRYHDVDAFVAALATKGPDESATVTLWGRGGGALGCEVTDAEEAREVCGRYAEAAEADRLRQRRPHLWAELRPEALAAHMARRPKGHARHLWAEELDDVSLDHLLTVDEQADAIARDAPNRMAAHMRARPPGMPRPDWRRRIVPAPAGGYDAYARLVLASAQANI